MNFILFSSPDTAFLRILPSFFPELLKSLSLLSPIATQPLCFSSALISGCYTLCTLSSCARTLIQSAHLSLPPAWLQLLSSLTVVLVCALFAAIPHGCSKFFIIPLEKTQKNRTYLHFASNSNFESLTTS